VSLNKTKACATTVKRNPCAHPFHNKLKLSAMNEVLRFQPLYQERVWGGRALEDALGRTLPAGRPIGESWEVVDRAEAQSVIADGSLAGLSLRAALEQHHAAIMGPGWPADRPFPILIKWLDCRDRLSLQVHPPADLAPALGGEPKTENWYIAATTGEANLIVGLPAGDTRGQFAQALVEGALERCVHRFPVQAGDSILVHSGTVHAIDGGNLILEIQQNSDTTYRVYDWGRVGLDGRPRQLHVAESLASIDWQVVEPAPVRAAPEPAVIAECAEFRIRRQPLAPGAVLALGAREEPRLVSVVEGRIRAAATSPDLTRGDNVLLPYAGAFSLTAVEPSVLLITDRFA
jgi:mannose-6-phosphate isomerase